MPQPNTGEVLTWNGSKGVYTPVTFIPTTIVYNTVYVMKNGSDSTGVVQRFDKPFLTIAAAVTAAITYFTSRDANNRVKIVVESGYYQDTVILHKFIDFDFGNSVIEITNANGLTDNGVDFGSTSSGVFTNIIYGAAKITATLGTYIYGVNTKVLIYCDSFAGTSGDALVSSSPWVRLYANSVYCSATTFDYIQTVNPLTGSLIEIFGANIYNVAGALGSTVEFNGGTSLSDCGVLKLYNCNVCSRTNSGSTVIKSAIQTGGTSANNFGILYLYNTSIYSQYGNSIAVPTSATMKVYCYGVNNANTDPLIVGAGVLSFYLGNLSVDPNVVYNNLP